MKWQLEAEQLKGKKETQGQEAKEKAQRMNKELEEEDKKS